MSWRSTTHSSIPLPEKKYLLIAIGLLVLYVLPYVWLGEGAYLTIHDNLDSDFLYLHLLKMTGTAFDLNLNTVIPNVMSGGAFTGIPRSAFRTGINLEVLTFWLLPPYVAQVVNFIAIHSLGFLGMYLLLRKYVLPESPWAFTRVALAFLFALVPYYTVHGASVSGQPLLLVAFLNIRSQRSHWTDWLIISLFPFYSFFVWAGLFICVALGVIGALDSWNRLKNQLNSPIYWSYWRGLLLLSSLYLLSEWQMIYSFLAKTFISHRTEYDYARLMPMTGSSSLLKAYHYFVQTQYHAGAFITVGILAVAGLAGLRAYRHGQQASFRQLVILTASAGFICLITGFYRFPAVWLGPGTILQAFQFDRFYFLLPTLWFYLFAVALRQFSPTGSWNRLFLTGQFVVMLIANNEWRVNIATLMGQPNDNLYPSYRAFYAPDLFSQIRDYIGKPLPSYRVISVGMHPAVALYNGFYTLDGYQNNYLLSYKHAFREVIAPELDKVPTLKNYFDAYGCRCYTYSAELGMTEQSALCGKNQGKSIRQLSLNTSAFRALGGQYILAAVPIRNAADLQLHLENVFDQPASFWRIWLYRVE